MRGVTVAIPQLRSGNDLTVATRLGEYVRDAQNAVRRIAICGLFIETVVADLPRGQLGPWIDAHEDKIGVKRSSIFAWRQFVGSLLEAVGLQKSNALDFSIPLHEALALPPGKLPADMQEVVAKIDEVISGKSYRQLFFEFKTAQENNGAIEPKTPGGDTSWARKKLTSEQEHEIWLESARRDCIEAFNRLFDIRERKLWQAPSLKDGELEDAAGDIAELAMEIRAWLRTPKAKRVPAEVERFVAQLPR